ncbi:MAG TPA: hypothetical protein VGA15_28620, partial [Bradyrhizobium sp.]
MFLPLAKTSCDGTGNIAKNATAGPPLHLTRILAVAAYVRCVTAGVDPRLKLALSRAAQRHVFALWVFASGAIGRRLPRIALMGYQLVAALPGGRMHRLLTTL